MFASSLLPDLFCCLVWSAWAGLRPYIYLQANLSLWPPNVKNSLIEKAPDAGKDCRQEEKGMAEDEMVGWHHQLDGHEFE